MVLGQSMASAIHIAALALDAQQSQFPIAIKAPLPIFLFLFEWYYWYFLEEIGLGACGGDSGAGSGDGGEGRHFFLFVLGGRAGLKGRYSWHLGQDCWEGEEWEGKRQAQVFLALVGVCCSRLIIMLYYRIAEPTFQTKLLIKIPTLPLPPFPRPQQTKISSETTSSDHLLQQLPHEDAAPPHHHLVQNLPLVAGDLEGLLQCEVHEHVHSDHDALDLPSPVELDAELLGDVLGEVGGVALFGESTLDCACLACHLQQTSIIRKSRGADLNTGALAGLQRLLMSKERDLFQSILCKFIINLPEEEMRDLSRLSYHAEKAYYYYIDKVYFNKEPKNEGEFYYKLAQYAAEIVKFDSHQIAVKLQENKPVCGAIVFNREGTKVLVIKVRGKFGFPKGKWNQHETAQACAAREVQEETGVYIHHRIDPKIRIEFESHDSKSYFFVARGVGEEERLKIDRKEVDGVCWMWIEDVRLNQSRFVQKSRIAWSHYEKELTHKGMDIDEFIQQYGKEEEKEAEQDFPNPFLCFKLDRERLKLCLSQGE